MAAGEEEAGVGLAEEVEAAALVAHAGLDAHLFLASTDPVEIRALQAVADRVLELQANDRRELALLIRNQIAELFG